MTGKSPLVAATENTVPLFWLSELATAATDEGLEAFTKGLETMDEAEKLDFGLTPEFQTSNRVVTELHTLRLRDFSPGNSHGDEIPTVVDAPYAGHSAVIADFHKGQSLVETLLENGLSRVLLTDWKSATPEMKDYDIDNYLAEINVCVDDLGGKVNLVGLCQGGWMSAMYAARYPHKVNRIVLAGSPIDTDAGNGPIKQMAHSLPYSLYEDLVKTGGGLMRGRTMLTAWKQMHPGEHYIRKYIDLYEHIDDPVYVKKKEAFEAWYENPIDLPGHWYLQAIKSIFKENLLAKGKFVGLGRKLSLGDITCPAYLLAGEGDDITTKEQVFDAEKYLGTPADQIVKTLAPGGHIGLFMGKRTLKDYWPKIADWLKSAT